MISRFERAIARPEQSALLRGPRDPRIDFFRGVALIWIFIDHVPGNLLAHLTLRNFGFSDASELFVGSPVFLQRLPTAAHCSVTAGGRGLGLPVVASS